MACLWRKRGHLTSSAGFVQKETQLVHASWLKSAVFYESLLSLGAVDMGVFVARGNVQVAALSSQTAAHGCSPNKTLHLFFHKHALPAVEPDAELVSCSLVGSCTYSGAPPGLRGSC